MSTRSLITGVLAVAGVLAGVCGPAAAQPISFRFEATTIPFTPLHSYSVGEIGDDVVAIGGISGMGLHHLLQSSGIVSFPLSVYNRSIWVTDQAGSQVYEGALDHLPQALRERLIFTSGGFVQFGDTLYLYGGYGPRENDIEWYTHASVVQVDLSAVRDAIKASQPVPESAFTVMPSTAAQVAGTFIVRLGDDRFALVGGSNFSGDYGLGGYPGHQAFENIYSDSIHIFDVNSSFTTPIETFTDSFQLHRRDLNALPITMADGKGGARPGLTVAGGVFNAVFPWENPLIYGRGDASVAVDYAFVQKMNQYEAPNASFWSASEGVNRMFLMGGISAQVWDVDLQIFYYDFLIPWVSDITELTMADDGYTYADTERVIGYTPVPITNAHLLLRDNIPQNSSHQIMLDETPHNEHLLGRIFGGLTAVAPGGEPATFASSTVYNVYVVVGVRGDVTKDGVVNFADLNILLGQYNETGEGMPADLNLDGVVNFADLNVVLSNFNSTTPG